MLVEIGRGGETGLAVATDKDGGLGMDAALVGVHGLGGGEAAGAAGGVALQGEDVGLGGGGAVATRGAAAARCVVEKILDADAVVVLVREWWRGVVWLELWEWVGL